MSVRSLSVVGFALLLGGLALACGGKSPASNSGTPTPVGVDTATPIPTPSPSPFPGISGCNLPASGPGVCRERTGNDGHFQNEVDSTVLEVKAAHPEYFNSAGALRDFGRFRVAMISGLEARGLCAVVDGEEIAIKNTNDYSEQWKVELSNGTLRIGPLAYRATCRPANFPADLTPIPRRGDCPNMDSTREYACSKLDESKFLPVVEKVYDRIIAEHPEITDGFTVSKDNWKAFYDTAIEYLRADGYCAIFDGEELAVKNSTEFSEQFHPVLSSTALRRGYGHYRGTCAPAAF
jgi:hypothetical protein